MTIYWNNFKGWNLDQNCPVCRVEDQPDTQQHSFNCKVIKQNIQVRGKYMDSFDNVNAEVASTVENVEIFREKYLNV